LEAAPRLVQNVKKESATIGNDTNVTPPTTHLPKDDVAARRLLNLAPQLGLFKNQLLSLFGWLRVVISGHHRKKINAKLAIIYVTHQAPTIKARRSAAPALVRKADKSRKLRGSQ
jgi:hypothetical protein